MKYVTMVMTEDSALHRTLDEAQRHAKKRYGEALSALAHRMVSQTDGKYGRTVEFIDANLNAFANLVPLSDDTLPLPPIKNCEDAE